jgi:hypothetical protein
VAYAAPPGLLERCEAIKAYWDLRTGYQRLVAGGESHVGKAFQARGLGQEHAAGAGYDSQAELLVEQ